MPKQPTDLTFPIGSTRFLAKRPAPRCAGPRFKALAESLVERPGNDMLRRNGAKSNPRDGSVGGIAAIEMVPLAGIENCL